MWMLFVITELHVLVTVMCSIHFKKKKMQRHNDQVFAEEAEDYYNYIASDEEEDVIEEQEQEQEQGVDIDMVMSENNPSRQILIPLDTTVSQQSQKKTSPHDDASSKISPHTLQKHQERCQLLTDALDAYDVTKIRTNEQGQKYLEAPFRFSLATTKAYTSPLPTTSKENFQAPEQEEEDKEIDENNQEDDPLYDQEMDDADAKWVQDYMRPKSSLLPETDATLNCPCCFVTLSMDCQRHVKYLHQYRATCAMNCRVKRDEILRFDKETQNQTQGGCPPLHHSSKNISDSRSTGIFANMTRYTRDSSGDLERDDFFPVVCSDCGTIVGVYDQQRQYHFFNVLPSSS